MSSSQIPTILKVYGHLALALLALLPTSILVVRAGAWQPGLILYALACLLAGLALLAGVLLLVWPRFERYRQAILGRCLLVLPGTLLLLSMLVTRGDYPPIHDITTDLVEPPTFRHAPQLRGAEANPLTIKPDSLERQAQAYPALQTLYSDMPQKKALQHAVTIAEQLGWRVVYRDDATGTVEAVDRTAIMGFRDDIVIRVQQQNGGSAVDLRSVSRVGIGDMGANATRIRAFLKAFTEKEQTP